jgi:O-antigen ligase
MRDKFYMEFNNFRTIVIVGLALTPLLMIRPKLIMYLYLALILYMPNTLALGVKKGTQYLNLYAAGTGMVVRPLISFYLLGLFILSLFLYRDRESIFQKCLTAKILLLLSAYFTMYAFWGIATDIPLVKVLDGPSTVHLVDMTFFLLVLLRFCSDEKELSRLSWFLVFCVSTRELYGLARFIFSGGDFSNVYANVEKIKVKVTFQDFNDSLLGCLVGYFCAWDLTFNWASLKLRTKLLYLMVVPLTIFTMMFTFRRSIWIGLFLAGSWFVLRQPMRRRIQLGAVVAVLACFTFTTLLSQRLGRYEHHRSSMFFYDILGNNGEVTMKAGRFAELERAKATILDNIMTGVGPWGTLANSKAEYVHGGVLQIWLKLGFVGFALFSLALLAYLVFYLRKSREVPPEQRGWFEAGFAGLLFMIPDFSIGTPVVEYRTMQLLGLCLALPYLVHAIRRNNREAVEVPAASRTLRRSCAARMTLDGTPGTR